MFKRILCYGATEYNTIVERDWSSSSYDYVFNTEEEAIRWYEGRCNDGYGDNISYPCEVTVEDDIRAFLDNEFKSDNECTTLHRFLKECNRYGCIPISINYAMDIAIVTFSDYQIKFDCQYDDKTGNIIIYDYFGRFI